MHLKIQQLCETKIVYISNAKDIFFMFLMPSITTNQGSSREQLMLRHSVEESFGLDLICHLNFDGTSPGNDI